MNESESLREKLLTWLTKQGYPLEMRFASMFRQQTKLDVRQGWHYSDPETAVSREIDVVCTHSEALGLAAVHFAISCKAGSKPWILFTSLHTMDNYSRLLRFAFTSREARGEIADSQLAKSDPGPARRPPLSWFWDDSATGYTIVQAFNEKTDVPFSATVSAVKAALYCCLSSPQHNSAPRFSISFPVVVTSAPLFACSMDETGATQLSEIDVGFLLFQQKIRDIPAIRVAVVAEKGVTSYVGQCKAVVSELQAILAPAVEREWKGIQARSRGAEGGSSAADEGQP